MSGLYNPKPNQKPYHGVSLTENINIDNGASATNDVVAMVWPEDGILHSAKIVYTEATDSSGAASANVKLGTAAGGAQVVAQKALEVSKSVGDATALTLVKTDFAAGDVIFVRHTGIAATEAGEYKIQLEYSFNS